MAIAQGDGSIILTTKVDESGLKKGMQQANKFAEMSTKEQRRMAQSLSKVYRQQGMSQSEAQKKAWHDLKNNTAATKDLAKATEDVAKKTDQATKETKEYGDTAKRSGSTAKGAFLAVGKVLVSVVAAASAAVVAITKQAVDAYAEFEQLAGGVQKIFDQANIAQIMEDANAAFLDLGMSANAYLRTINDIGATFSATMGDQKGYDTARQGLLAISDYASGTGKNIDILSEKFTMITRSASSYQSIADQFSGILPATSADFLAQAKAAGFLSNQYTKLTEVPIAEYQQAVTQMLSKGVEELGLMGNTAAEAATTISGSANMMKAAWQNVLSAIAGGGDLDRAIDNLVDSIGNLFENIVPVVERSLKGIGRLIERVAPQLVQTVAKALIEAIPSLLNAVYEMIIGLAKGIYQGITDLFRGKTTEIIESQAEKIEESTKNQNSLTEAVKETNKELKGSLAGFDELNTITKDSGELDMSEVLPSSSSATTLNIQTEFEEQEIKMPEPVLAFFKTIKKILQPTLKLLRNCVKATKDWVKNVDFSSVVPAVVDAISEALNALTIAIDKVRNGLSALIEKIKPFTDFIGDVVVGIIEFFGDIFRKVAEVIESKGDKIQGIFEGIGDIVLALQPIFEALWYVVKKVFTFIAEVVGGVVGLIIDVLGGLIDFIVGVFSGDWSRAWDGIKGIFVGIWDFICKILSGFWQFLKDIFSPIVDWIDENIIQPIGNFFSDLWEGIKKGMKAFANFFIGIINGLIGGLESFINFFVDAINKVVDALNSLSFDVPDWIPGIGGKTFGFNLSRISKVSMRRIPELAQGAVIPPNREFLAVLGDQTHGTNVEAPLTTIKQALVEAMSEFGGSGNNQPIIIEIDGREVFRAVRNAESRYGSQTIIGGVTNAY